MQRLTDQEVNELSGLLACPACGCGHMNYSQLTMPTDTRADDHYRRFVCAEECGFAGDYVMLNATWDEDKTKELARQEWNRTVARALERRLERALYV